MTETTEHNGLPTLPFKQHHAFILGINDYQKLHKLRTAVNDAIRLAKILAEEQKFNVHPPLLNATHEEIIRLLNETIIEKVKEEDRFLFYFAGHGLAEEGNDKPEGYIVPVDGVYNNLQSYISMEDIYTAINRLPCKHVLLIFDCCFAGAFKWATRFRHSDPLIPKRIFRERYNWFVKDRAWQVITSASTDQRAMDAFPEISSGNRENKDMDHSLFAKALFRGLQGEADLKTPWASNGDGLILASELYLYLREQVELRSIALNEKNRQTPGIFQLKNHDKGEFIFFNPKHTLNLPPVPGRNPYKGLDPFENNENDLFYGREQAIIDLIQQVNDSNLIIVTGASGTGKTSLVKAGLIPELHQRGYHILPVIQPGKTPMAALEKTINDSNLFATAVSLVSNKDAIIEKFNLSKTMIIIDQFEELITQCSTEEERKFFIQILKDFLDKNKSNLLKIILTVRSDFETQFENSALQQYWEKGVYKPLILTQDEMRHIILKPIEQEVMDIDPLELVNRIINDLINAPGPLPLLSLTLSELNRMYLESGRMNRTLIEYDFNKLGGVSGVILKQAYKLYRTFDRKHKLTLHKIILRLVTFEEGFPIGKKVLIEELKFSDEEYERVKTIIDKLVEARLILIDRDVEKQVYVEPAHHALVKDWKISKFLLKPHEKTKFQLLDQLNQAVKNYNRKNDKRYLWNNNPGLRVLEIELKTQNHWLNKQEVLFVDKSIKLRRKRNVTRLLVSFIIILFVLVFFEIYQKARADSLVYQARQNLNNTGLALELARKAYHLDKNKNVMQVLSQAAAETLEHPLCNLNLQHKYNVNTAVFSPSGRTMLTASEDKTAKLWDLQGTLLQDLKHKKAVTSASFSPDGLLILTVPRDKAVKLWDLQGNLLQHFMHQERINSAVFSPDGRTILTASNDNTARLWNVQGFQLNVFYHPSDVNAAVFSPKGSRILTLCKDKTAWLLNLNGSPITGFPGVNSAEFSPNGKFLIFILMNKTIKLRNLEDNTEKNFKDLPGYVTFAAFSPDSCSFVLAYLGGAFEVRELNGQTITSLGPHKDTVYSVAFSPDNTKILTSSRDKTAKLWDLNGSMIADLHLHRDHVISAVFSPNGTQILTASRDLTAKMWDLKDQLVSELISQNGEMKCANFSPDNTKILTISRDNIVQLWDMRGNLMSTLNTINEHKKTIHMAVLCPDGTRILTASADNTAKLWDLEGSLITDFNLHTGNVESAVFSPNGRFILTASYDKTARLWDLQGTPMKSYKHQKAVISARFSPDGKNILTSSFDETARLWDLKGKELVVFKRQYGQVKVAKFSPDGTKVLTLSASVRLWYINGKHLAEFNILKYLKGKMRVEENHFVSDADFSPDSKRVLTIHNDNTARLWNLKGKLLTQMVHKAKINTAFFSQDSTRIITASADNTIKLWDLQGNLLSDLVKHKGEVYSAVFSPDGHRILSTSTDKTVKLWYTPRGIIHKLEKPSYPLPPQMKEATNNKIKKGD